MGITSVSYMAFVAGVLLIYYLLPIRFRWIALLTGSIAYMLLAGDMILILYPILSVLIAWICTGRMNSENESAKKLLLGISLAGCLGVLIALKYLNLGIYTYNAVFGRILTGFKPATVLHFPVPVGVSFYTMSLLGYIFDVYYGICKSEKNYFRLLLFTTYFPLMISGPIVRYEYMNSRFTSIGKFDYKNFTYGIQRIIWGFFKVLVISERLAVAVGTVYDDYESYSGVMIVLATISFSFQLYTNFSGSMDIVIGISEAMGIELPENFRQPFFSETIQEFWQRWHITLGAWLKDYILYPVLRTEAFRKLQNKLKDKMNKKKAKQLTTFAAMAILWFAVGLWHGGSWKYIWGTGLLQCVYIIISELCSPFFKGFYEKHGIRADAVIFRYLRKLRTFLLISVGFMFFNANSLSDGFGMLGRIVTDFGAKTLTDGSVMNLGLEMKDWCITIVSLLILWGCSILQTKESLRDRLAKKHILIRWAVLYMLLFYVIIFGRYGPGFSAAEFIYQGF